MFDLIANLHNVLNMVKDFGAGYNSSDAFHGYMLMHYKGRKYAVKVVEMDEEDQKQDSLDAMDNIKHYFKD